MPTRRTAHAAYLLSVVALTLLTTPLHGQGAALPDDALFRLGSVRLQHGNHITGLAFSPDGKALASASHDHTVRVWDPETGKERLRLRHKWAGCVAFSPDGKTLASGGGFGGIRLWDAGTGKQRLHLTGQRAASRALAFSPDGRLLAAGSGDGTVRLWDVTTGRELRELSGHKGEVKGVAFAPDGETLASCGDGVRLWKVTGETVRSFSGDDPTDAIAFAAGGKVLAAASGTVVRLWDPATGEEKAALKGHSRGVGAIAVGAGGKLLASTDYDGALRLWDVGGAKLLRTIEAPWISSRALALSPGGKVFASITWSSRIDLWDAETGKPLLPETRLLGCVTTLACSPDGRRVITADTTQGLIHVWDIGKRQFTLELCERSQCRAYAAPSANWKLLLGGRMDRPLCLWELPSGKKVREVPLPADSDWRGVALSPDGKTAAAGWYNFRKKNSAVLLWDIEGGKELRSLEVSKFGASDLAFSPDGTKLALLTEEGNAGVWEVSSGKRLWWKEDTFPKRLALAFHPRGNLLATACNDGSLAVLRTDTGEAVRRLNGHPTETHAVAFSPDGRALASGGNDGTARLWELASGRELCRFAGHAGWVLSVAFSPDGRRLYSGGADATVLVWDVTGQLSGKVAKAPLSPESLREQWDALIADDASRSYRAVWSLALDAERGVPFLRERLAPLLGVDAEHIQKLIEQLNHDRFAMRQKASTDLAQLGQLALPALRQALAKGPPPEVKRRIADLLRKLKAPHSAEQERLRALRTLEVLEKAATAAARRLLRDVAAKAADADLKSEAKATLARLAAKKSDG